MFINSRKTEKEIVIKYCVTITFLFNRRTMIQPEPLKLFFNSNTEVIIDWFNNRDTDTLLIEYDQDSITEQFKERMLLERKTIQKMTMEIL